MQFRRQAMTRTLGIGALTAALISSAAFADGERYASRSYKDAGADYTAVVTKPYIFYVGGAIGEYWIESSHTHQALNAWNNFAATQAFLNERGTGSMNGSDMTISAFMGLERRTNNVLLGVEFDANYIGFHRRTEVAPGIQNTPGGNGAADFFNSARISHLETLRLRLGYTFAQTTLFMTAGLALGEVEFSQSINFPFSTASFSDGRGMRYGWVIGAGLERQLSRDVSLRAEYLYADLGSVSRNYTNSCPAGNSTPLCSIGYGPGFDHRVEYDVTTQIARIGLKVAMSEFGGGGSEPYKAGAVPGAYVDYTGMKTDFTGLYISPIAGTISGQTTFALNRFNLGYAGGGSSFFDPATAGISGGNHTVKFDGFTFGGVLGYQKQFSSNLVLGADVGLHSGASADGRSDCTPDGVSRAVWQNQSASCSSRLLYDVAFRVRAGYAMDKWMVYVNGGPAFAKVDNDVTYGGTITAPNVPGGTLNASYFNEKGTYFTKGWTYGAGLEYEWKPGVIVGLSYNHTQLDDVIVDLRRLDGTTNSRRTIGTDPDVIGSSLKIKLGDTAQAPVAAPPAPATQQVAAAAAPPPAAAAPAPAAQPAAATPRPQRPRPAAARPAAARPAAAPAAKPAASPAKPVDGTPTEPAPQMGKPQK